MPSRVKLLNAALGNTIGPTIVYSSMGKLPYTIRVQGGFTPGGGANGTKGVNIETSFDQGVTWARDFGEIGGEGAIEAQTAELIDLASGTTVKIDHYVRYIRAVAGSGIGGTATVWLEASR